MSSNDKAKPHYLELLNSIALAERSAGVYLRVWAETTQDGPLKGCLSMVADRETSHYQIFKRRIAELGYSLVEEEDPDLDELVRISASDDPDIDKIRQHRDKLAMRPKPTLKERREAAISDETIDPLTRSLIRWYSDVENDSRVLMDEAYSGVEARAETAGVG